MSAPTADEVRAFLNVRVQVEAATSADGHVAFVRRLAAFTPGDVLLLADEKGFEVAVQRDDVLSITDARYECLVCGDKTNTTHGGEAARCADCERRWASRQPVPNEICAWWVEGTPEHERAYYSPRAKCFGCAQCHAEHGTNTGSSVEMRARDSAVEARKAQLEAAPCRTADKDSDLHDWVRAKSTYSCRNCNVKVFGKPAGART